MYRIIGTRPQVWFERVSSVLRLGFHSAPVARAICLVYLLLPGIVQAQGDNSYEINSLRFEGNESFGDGDLEDLILTRESPGFFGSILHSISENLGDDTQYFDPVVFEQDLGILSRHYEDHGFTGARLDTSFTFNPDDSSMDILVHVTEGNRARVDTISYTGLDRVAPSVKIGIKEDPLIKKGDPFQKALVEEEIRRVRDLLQNEGYPNHRFLRDSSAAMRLLSTGNYTIVLRFVPGKRYRFDEVEIVKDTTEGEVISDDIIIKQLDYAPGDYYSEVKRHSSERNLNRLGIFTQARISSAPPPDSSVSSVVPTVINVRMADKHELSPEVSISDEDKAFNIGTGLVYLQRNFLGGARTFSAGLRFRTQTLREFPDYFAVNSEAVSNMELSFEILQPYIFSNKVKGSWTFSLIVDKQKLYRQEIIKNTFRVSDRLGRFTTGYFDWTLQKVRLQRNTSVELDLSDPETKQQYDALLSLEKDVQFNSILSFTLQRDKTNDIFSPSEGFIHAVTVEESGLLPLLLGSVKREFTQFLRGIVVGRWYFDLTRDRSSILGVKLKGGIEQKYGESASDTSRVIPQTHRFFAGGGGSVRGWPSRGLIASGVPELGGNLALEGTMELRTNLFRSFRDAFLNHVWTVAFLDAGNVWTELGDYHVRNVALAAGIGIRYDTFFGPFRIDFGIRVYDPAETEPAHRWITGRRFFGETVADGALHFGIGHAF
jgi:outer membrane protein assembly factor BamA